jgi:hypothetical protein
VTRDEISLNAALEIMAELHQPHIGGLTQVTAAIQCIVNTALDREREECAKVCDARVFAIDGAGNEYRREATASQCAAAIRARAMP